MKKLFFVLLAVMLLIPYSVDAREIEIYKKSYEIEQEDYGAQITVISKRLEANNFIAGYKLDDYVLTGLGFYKGISYSGAEWASPDYIIQEGAQDIGIKIRDANKNEVIVYVEMYGTMPLKKQLISRWVDHPSDRGMSFLQYGDFSDLPEMSVFDAETGVPVRGKTDYLNLDPGRLGTYDLEWLFTPDDPIYDSLTGTIKIDVRALELKTPDEPTPSLTVSTLLLETRATYDINLNDKISGSKYKWNSSNDKVAKVNAKNGLVTAVSEGTATITCEIALPDGEKQTLTSVVTVGYDDNAPVLTETILDLNPGDKFDINLENKIARSKYRWVSSNRNIVTVNSSNGIVTAKAAGTAYITCTITSPENQVIVLRCDISVTE